MNKVGVIGAGAWGTALAQSICNAGRDVIIWARESEVAESIQTHHENSLYLKGIPLNERLQATADIHDLSDVDALLIVTPAQFIRQTLENFKDVIADKPFIICSKGIELKTGLLMSEVIADTFPEGSAKAAYLSGPTFATEIAKGLPCAVTLAMEDTALGEELVNLIGSRTLRTYLSNDIIGTQIGGAIKNVIAIACGVVEGRGMGESARCALITRGLAEMGRLAKAMGAQKSTLMGMCGVGDLMLTCSSMQSRNYSFGFKLGKGQSMEDILNGRIAVTEGVHTAKALKVMAQNNAVDMPISSAVYDFIEIGASIEEVMAKTLDRPLRKENI